MTRHLRGSPDRPAVPAASPLESVAGGIVVLNFGGQTSQLIARRVRELGVFAELLPGTAPWEEIAARSPRGVILSGGPASVYEAGAPHPDPALFSAGLPVLGICYGMQLLAHHLGGRVSPSSAKEFGPATLERLPTPESEDTLFSGLPDSLGVWMSHGDRVEELPVGFRAVARTDNAPYAAMVGPGGMAGIQFHPEVVHTPLGKVLLSNFVFGVCGCERNWDAGSAIERALASLRAQVGDGRVLCALSGGVDSAVTALLIQRAVPGQLTCVFVDTGLLRQGEGEELRRVFQERLGLSLRYVEAEELFLDALKGVTDPELKRERVGHTFIDVFRTEAAALGGIRFLAQGTLYPDVIESSGQGTFGAVRIKTHHNVGGLPADLDFELVEPLRLLFKDEVRAVGVELGLPEEWVWRHPFPGPGLAVRVMGEVTRERVAMARAADAIVRAEIRAAGLDRTLWQVLVVMTGARSVGVQGDGRHYGEVAAVRAVTSDDAMTADWARLPESLLARLSNRLVNEVPGLSRVVYDITSKPPATIEWE